MCRTSTSNTAFGIRLVVIGEQPLDPEPIADRVRRNFVEAATRYHDLDIAPTVSVGVMLGRPDKADIDFLLIGANRALYRAKAGGRNRVEIMSPDDELEAAVQAPSIPAAARGSKRYWRDQVVRPTSSKLTHDLR